MRLWTSREVHTICFPRKLRLRLNAVLLAGPALTMALVSKLIQKSDAKVFCGFAKRLPNAKGFKVIVQEADQGIYSEDESTSLSALNSTVEKNVLMAIEQYQWEYKRFRKQADGSKFY